MSGVKLKKNYRRLKTQKHLLNMGLYRFFMKTSINNLLMQFFHIMNCTMWSNKMILYQYLVVAFFLRTSSPMKTLYTLLRKLGKWKNRHPVYQFLKFILSCRFTFNAYAKIIREKTTKCSLKTAEILLHADGLMNT